MKVLNDFTCESCDHTDERFEEMKTKQVICHTCGHTATKRIRPIRSVLEPISGTFPGATAKWEKGRQDQMKRERKALRDHDDEYVPRNV